MNIFNKPCGTFEDMSPRKLSAMRWCLAEAKLDRERAFVKNAENAMLAQDASGGWNLVRVSVSSTDMTNERFTLGYSEIDGTDAFALRDTTEKVITRWATSRANLPKWEKTRAVASSRGWLGRRASRRCRPSCTRYRGSSTST